MSQNYFGGKNKTQRFDGVNYKLLDESKFGHRIAKLGNYRGAAFITGCFNEFVDECGFKTEIMDMSTFQWNDGPDYPFNSFSSRALE